MLLTNTLHAYVISGEECNNELPTILDLKLVKDKTAVSDVIFDNKLKDVAKLLSENSAKMRERADKINFMSQDF